jgi:hypothetical protein
MRKLHVTKIVIVVVMTSSNRDRSAAKLNVVVLTSCMGGNRSAGKGAVRPANAAQGPGELLEQLPLEAITVVTSPHQVTQLRYTIANLLCYISQCGHYKSDHVRDRILE